MHKISINLEIKIFVITFVYLGILGRLFVFINIKFIAKLQLDS